MRVSITNLRGETTIEHIDIRENAKEIVRRQISEIKELRREFRERIAFREAYMVIDPRD